MNDEKQQGYVSGETSVVQVSFLTLMGYCPRKRKGNGLFSVQFSPFASRFYL